MTINHKELGLGMNDNKLCLEIGRLSITMRAMIKSEITTAFIMLFLVTVMSFMSTVPSVNGAGFPFSSPQGVGVDTNGLNKIVYVADTGNNRIQKFILANPCPAGTTQIDIGVCFVTIWGSYGQGNNQFNRPVDIAVDSSGDVYVADAQNHRIQKFTADGIFITGWGLGPTNATGLFNFPNSVSVDKVGDVWVADSNNNRIQKFRLANPCPAGTTQVPYASGVCFVIMWGTKTQNGIPLRPAHIDLDNAGNLYVSEGINGLIQKLKLADPCPAGTSQVYAGLPGLCLVAQWDAGYFIGDIAPDYSGNLFATATAFNKIYMYKFANPCPAGTTKVPYATGDVCLAATWGSKGIGHYQFFGPVGLAVDQWNNLYVDDWLNNRIEKFTNAHTYLLTIKPTFQKTFPLRIYVSQQCIPGHNIEYQWAIHTGPYGRYNFDPTKQDMVFVLNGIRLSYGSAVSIGGTDAYPPWFGFGPTNTGSDVLVFVENKATANHVLDPGELSATTTFLTKYCQ
jgi:DNA-binding beta-propeller fold protein YncE